MTAPTAIVTASYAGDLERFALLAETLDARVTGWTRHLVLVASKDVELFRRFAGPRREIIDEADILPSWLRRFSDPLSGFRRDVWLSLRTMPMRGWHAQQLRRIAIARHIDEAAYVSVDSDVCFVAPHDIQSHWRDGLLRLYRVDGFLARDGFPNQKRWSANAGRRLGLAQPTLHDYVNTLIGWRRQTVLDMIDRLEAVSGRHWVSAIGADRAFSECMLYGRFADEAAGGAHHFHSDAALCHVYWGGPALDRAGLQRFFGERGGGQVAVGLQSFIGTSIADIRAALAALPA